MIRESSGSTQKVVPIDPLHNELTERAARVARADGINRTALAALSVIRASEAQQPMPSVYAPSLCVVLQGRKRALLGSEWFNYDPFNYLFVSVTLPALGQVLDAAPERPYICLRIDIDLHEVSRLVAQTKPATSRGSSNSSPLYVARMSSDLTEVLLRLVRLLEAPDDLSVLGPTTLRELWYRLLRSDTGPRLRAITETEGLVQRIHRAIEILQQRFHESLRIEELAAAAHLSPSTFHARFKAVTAMSPLQFQKQLRLHEARRLMIGEGLDAAVAAHRVGYESPSQFSREYRRLFGAPPRREVNSLQQERLAIER